MADARATFRKPFAEGLAALRLRFGDLVPTVRWDDIPQVAHDRAFMVAGAMKADLLTDLAKAVDRIRAEGITLEAFKADFLAIAEKHGWKGWTGQGTEKGERWRARVIYRTNMLTSRAAGRRAQLIDGEYPFWVYRHSGAEHPRLHHLEWDGVALPPDHPFWATNSPPNGWGCGCEVYGARTEAGIRRVGGDPGKKLPDGWDMPDPKTGLPPGIDKGWDHAPGATVSDTVLQLRDKLDRLPEEPSITLIQDWLTSETFGRWMEKPAGAFPLVRIPQTDAQRIGAQRLIAELSAETAAKQLREHPELSLFDYARAQSVVTTATHAVQDGPTTMVYVKTEAGDGGHVLVVKATLTGQGLFVTSFRRLSTDEAERDRVVRRILRRER